MIWLVVTLHSMDVDELFTNISGLFCIGFLANMRFLVCTLDFLRFRRMIPKLTSVNGIHTT